MRTGRYSEYVPLAAVVVGFIFIVLGWNGAASVDFTAGQIPFVISGGLGGLALVLFGSAGMVVRAIKRGQAQMEDQFKTLAESLQRVPSHTVSATSDNPGHVLVGASSFHRPGCRVVGSRADSLERIPRSEALERALEPCRVCNP